MLKISFLGPFAVSQNDAPVIGFKTDHSRAILAITAYHRGVPQRRDALAGMLWPDAPNDKALKYFRVELNRLRPVIGDADADPAHFFINRKEIEFNPDSHAIVDVVLFESLLDEVNQHGHRTLAGCPSCISKLEQAAELYQGEFMAGFNLNSDVWQQWLTKQREGFKLQALELFGLLCGVQQERGEWASVLELGQKQIELDPWHEDGYQALMRASYSLGDRAGAMGWYEACEKVLYEELGVDPSAETLDLQQQILDDELDFDSGGALEIPDNLPVQTSPFFGREAEKEQLLKLLVDPNYRLVTLVGAGGIGKTRLSIEIGQQVKESFPDGVWFVQMADLTQSGGGMERLKIAVGEAAGLNAGQDGKQFSGDQVIAILREKRMLLIFDNSETVLDDLSFIPEWLKRAPGVAILASSREPLNFQTESVIHLAGLPINSPSGDSAAIGLFGERGRMAREDFEVTADNLPQVGQICEMVGGSPLGIALAAAWLRRRSLVQIIESVGKSLDFLTSRMRDIDPRHRSMRAVFETSWQLLAPEEQEVFAALSVFPGSFGEEAAEKIAGAMLFDLDALCEKSLLMQQHEDERYLMHGLVRQFAADKLKESGSLATVQREFIDYFYLFASVNKQDYAQLRPEWSNFSAGIVLAHELELWQLLLDFVGLLDEPWFRQARFTDMREGLELALDGAKALRDEAVFAQTLLRLGEIEMEQNDYGSAEPRLEAAMNLFMRQEDSLGIAHSKFFLGRIKSESAQFAEALELLQDSNRIFIDENNLIGIAKSMNYLAVCQVQKNRDVDLAIKYLEESQSLQESLPVSSTYIETLRSLARIKFMIGQNEEVNTLFQLAQETSQRLNDRGEYAALLYEKVYFYRKTGKYDQAIELGDECLQAFKQIGILRWEALIKTQIGLLHQSKGLFGIAEKHLLSSLEIFQEIGDLHEQAYSHYYLYRLYGELDDTQNEIHFFDSAKQLSLELDNTMLQELLSS
ncbi:MAG: BTAD domain-containing putative transcriptional regulator [Anaerolineae bacterium]